MGLHSLGKRHIKYGVKPEHYTFIRGPLMETIEEMLGDDFTQDVDNAWQQAIDLVLTLMQRGTVQEPVVAK
jgi:hemoglobin-like flavoprotein